MGPRNYRRIPSVWIFIVCGVFLPVMIVFFWDCDHFDSTTTFLLSYHIIFRSYPRLFFCIACIDECQSFILQFSLQSMKISDHTYKILNRIDLFVCLGRGSCCKCVCFFSIVCRLYRIFTSNYSKFIFNFFSTYLCMCHIQ